MKKNINFVLSLSILTMILVTIFAFSSNFLTTIEAQGVPENGQTSNQEPRCRVQLSEQDKNAREVDFQQQKARVTSRITGGVINVYWHVITDTNNDGNINDSKINEQLQTLNQAYAPMGWSFSLISVNRHANNFWYSAPLQLVPDTNQLVENSPEFEMRNTLHKGTAADLNIYSRNLPNALGWSTFPIEYASNPGLDGLVIRYDTLPGLDSSLLKSHDEGDTLVHEVGHWMGLYHTFEDHNKFNNGCQGPGDYVNDTPAQATPSNDFCLFPNPFPPNTCQQPGDDPIHNFMNYSSDRCLNEFSFGQADRMNDQFFIYRAARVPTPSNEKITVKTTATFNGQPWSGPVNYNIVGPDGVLIGSSVPAETKNLPAGQYTLKYLSGGPPNIPSPTITPSSTQTLTTRGTLTFNMNFETPRTPVWAMSGHDPQRRGQSPYTAPNLVSPAPEWVVTTGSPITSELAVSGEGVIYFASDKIYALNPNGTNYVPPVPLPAISSGSPAIDDVNGFVYFAFMITNSNLNNQFVIKRYNKQLQNETTVFEGVASTYGGIGHILVNNGTVYFISGRYPATVHAIGTVNWQVSICPAENSGAPAFGVDGSIYVTCWGDALYKLNGQTGATIKSVPVDRNQVEPMIDAQGNVFSGNQAFNGITYYGSYTKWDNDLNLISSQSDFTTSRSSLMPDGTSTIRLGYADQGLNYLSLRGATNWDIVALDRVNFTAVFTTPPSVDASGKIFIGKGSSVQCVRPSDGATIWESPTTGRVNTQPVIARNGAIYVGTSDGKIFAFPGN